MPNRASGAEATPAPDGVSDVVVRRIDVPSPLQRVGEVRWLRRGDAEVVQTMLFTRLLKRVVGEIRKKEEALWPPGAEGHGDAQRYIAALEAAQNELWEKQPKHDRNPDRTQNLLIEFLLDQTQQRVILYEFEPRRHADILMPAARRQITTLDLSRVYVRQNMRHILADSFHLDGDAAVDEFVGAGSRLR